MKLLLNAILRFAMFIALFVGLKSLIAWKFIVDWKDIMLAAIVTFISIRQSLVAEKKEKEDEKLAQIERKDGPW